MGILEVCDKLPLAGDAAFIGRGNLWIDNIYDPSVMELTRTVLYEAIMKTAPGQLSILACDNDLSGAFAPFAALSAGETRILEFVTDEKQLRARLMDLQLQIQAVQNVIQGREASLLAFRERTGRAIEGYKLVVLYMDLGLADQELMRQLSRLMRTGPAFGVSFLIVSTTCLTFETSSGREVERTISSIAPNITVLTPHKGLDFVPVPAARIIQDCDAFVEQVRTAALPSVQFGEIQDLSRMWTENSTNGLTFTIGKYGINNMEITIGDEINQRHNAIITGAVGQGKSNLLSVIIHSLCLRYSPEELVLYLLDFKEGVTFKAFSNIGQPDYLPHARTLGLESDVSFGQAVLASLFHEYQNRMKVLKEKNMKSIRELRLHCPDMKMPRIVVMIDEFQMMFGEDGQTSQVIADQLEKSVRLFRAAGIHFILASQTWSDSRALAANKDSIFSQIPIRIALKNSEREAREVLSMNNPAAAYVRPRESVVNLDYGELSQNRKTVIAFADEALLRPLRRQMWEKARHCTTPPYVFESERRLTISQAMETIGTRIRQALVPAAVIGDRISVDEERVVLPMPAESGRNLAVLGTPDAQCGQAVGILQSAALSLAAQHPQGEARFLFCDFASRQPYEHQYPQFAAAMENLGYFIEEIEPAAFSQTIADLLAEEPEEAVYVFGSSMDRWEFEPDPFTQASALKELAEKGPARNIHFLGWWVKASKFTAQTAGFGTSDAFNSKIFLRIDERTVQSLTSPFIRWMPQVNRGLLIDEVGFSQPLPFIPYGPVTGQDAGRFRQ